MNKRFFLILNRPILLYVEKSHEFSYKMPSMFFKNIQSFSFERRRDLPFKPIYILFNIMLCAKLNWYCLSCSDDEDERVKSLQTQAWQKVIRIAHLIRWAKICLLFKPTSHEVEVVYCLFDLSVHCTIYFNTNDFLKSTLLNIKAIKYL